MGYRPAVVNVYNVMCCYLAADRPNDALTLASRAWTEVSTTQEHALLWEQPVDNDDWRLLSTDDAAAEVAWLAGRVAQATGLLDDASSWRQRSADRRPGEA